MAIQTTLADYRQRFYERFDEGQSLYIDVAQANRLINEARAHLHNWIVVSDENYLVNEYTWNLVSNQRDYALPADFFKDLKVFWSYSDGVNPTAYRPLPRRMRGELRGSSAAMYGYGSGWGYNMGYIILGQALRLDPPPTAGATTNSGITMMYAPHYTPMVNDTDVELPNVVPGWDEYVVNQAVISAKLKEESAVNDIMVRQAEIKQLIEQDIVNRDMGQPTRMLDVSGYGAWSGAPGDGWRGR